MQVSKNVFTLTLIVILTLAPLGQAGLVASATPNAAAVVDPYLLTTVTGVGATPTGIAVDEVHNYIYVSSLGGSHLTRINGTGWGKVHSATVGVVYRPMGLAVDPVDQRVYVCNSTHYLSVVNGTDLQRIQAVDLGSGNAPMDVALNTDLGYAFATDFSHGRAYAVNMSNYVKSNINNLATGGTKIALSPDGKAAYVTCYSSNSVDVIDTARRELVARYFVHYNKPVGIAVNPHNGYLYVANSGNGKLIVVDDRNDLKHTITVAGTGTVKGVAYNPNTNRIFITRSGIPGHVYVYDGSSYAHIKTLTVQDNPDAFIAVDTTRNRVYVTNQGSGSVSVIQDADTAASVPPPAAYPPSEEVPATRLPDEPSPIGCPSSITNTVVGMGPRGIAVDDTHHVAYVANGTESTISRLSLDTNLVEATSAAGLVAGPSAMAVSTATQRVYVANGSSTSITVFDGTSLSTVGYISLLQKPKHIYLVPDPSAYRAYVVNHSDDSNTNYLSEIDTFTPAKLRDIVVGKGPYAATVSADREIAYVTCHDSSVYGGSFVSVVDISQGKEVGQFFTHYNQPTDIIMDPVRDRLYVANEGGNGKVVAVDHRNLLKGSLDLGGRPRGLALNPGFNRLAVVQKDASAVSFLDTHSFAQECVPIFVVGADRWIAFSALHNRFYASLSVGTTVNVIQDYKGDIYENDDSYSLANVILNEAPQVHSIDPAGDVDWVKFVVSEPMTPTFSTTDTYPTVYTTTLSLYDTDGTTLLVTGTHSVSMHLSTTGTYYVKVNATDANVGGSSYTYELLVTGGSSTYWLHLPLITRGEGF